MHIYSILNDLTKKNITVGLDDGKLKVYDPDKNLTSQLLSQLKANKEALIHFITYGDELTRTDFPYANLSTEMFTRIKANHVDLQNIYIATPMQTGMLYHGLLDGDGVSYTVQTFGELKGNLDTIAFVNAWKFIVERHDVFRTCFVGFGDESIHQLVKKKVQLPVFKEDFSNFNEEDQVQALVDFRDKDREKGFDFAHAPLTRISIIRLAEDRFHFVWTYHHVLLDGWCNSLIFGELMQAYQALSEGLKPNFAAVAPYVDYIGWLFKNDKEKSMAFWQHQLAGLTSPTPLPMQINSSMPTGQFRELPLVFDKSVSHDLAVLAKTHHCTVNVLLQFAWSYLLYCYTGEEDISFGATISGRPAELQGVEDMVGLFINSIPSRIVFDNDTSVLEQIRALHGENVLRNEHGYLSLTEIQQQSKIPSGTSLFDSLVIYENYPVGQISAEPKKKETVSISLIESEEQTNYGLTLYASFTDHLLVTIHYRTEQFKPEAITQIGDHLQHILTKMTRADLNLSLLDADFLDTDSFNSADVMRGPEVFLKDQACFHQQLTQQASKSPDAIALVCEGESFSYQELEQRSNQMAHYLQSQGVNKGDFVAVCLQRTPQLLFSLLAVQKVGATYIPVSVDYPQERISYMLDHAKAVKVISISQTWQAIGLPSDNVIMLDNNDVMTQLDQQSGHVVELSTPSTHDDIAYVIYTSGSTGLPKGVCIEQGAMINFLASMAKSPGFNDQDSLLAITPVSFDISVLELYLPLLVGGTVHLANEQVARDAFALSQYIDEYQISVMQATPATWTMLDAVNDWSPQSSSQSSRQFKALCGGEALPAHLATSMVKRYGEVWNMYGPTETTVWSGCQQITEEVMVGKPIDNTQFYILSPNLTMTLSGMAGELHIGGEGLARGYLNADEMTAERFIDNPFEAGGRLYKTGDLVRRRSDGSLDYLGRTDEQVKIRGFRIELGEIEKQLIDVEQIDSAVVVARDDGTGQQQLVAYIKVQRDQDQKNSEAEMALQLRNQLKNTLPDHMVPTAFVLIEQWPLTPNGKVNKKALPIPQSFGFQGEYVAPVNQTQTVLVGVWTNLLKLKNEDVSITANFFELGGHSLLLMRMLSEITEAFDVTLTVADVANAATLEVLSNVVDEYKLSQSLSGPDNDFGSALDDDEIEETL